jgi:hypothetical protein
MTGLSESSERRHRNVAQDVPLTLPLDFVTMRSNQETLGWFP